MICKEWHLRILSGWEVYWSEELAKTYKYPSCDLYNYRCDTSVYYLTQQDITGDKKDAPKNGNWAVGDRKRLQWKRWVYESCIDYNATDNNENSYNPTYNWERCSSSTVTPTAYHYKFVKCQNEYTFDGNQCMKDCSLTWSTGGAVTYHHGDVVTGYNVSSVICPAKCSWTQLVCDDGKWRLGETGNVVEWYYNYCKQGEMKCDGSYNLDADEKEDLWIYSSCDSYVAITCEKYTKRKFEGCKAWYHHVPGTTWHCESDKRQWTCNQAGEAKPENSHYTSTQTSSSWEYYQVWRGDKWESEYPDPCAWECDTNYVQEGNSCRELNPSCDEPNYWCKDATKVPQTNPWDGSGSVWKCGNEWCARCDEGTSYRTWDESTLGCYKDVNGICGDVEYTCISWIKDNRGETDSQYNWACLGIGVEMEDVCHKCKTGYHDEEIDWEMVCIPNQCSPNPDDNGPFENTLWWNHALPLRNNTMAQYSYSNTGAACFYRCMYGYFRFEGQCKNGADPCDYEQWEPACSYSYVDRSSIETTCGGTSQAWVCRDDNDVFVAKCQPECSCEEMSYECHEALNIYEEHVRRDPSKCECVCEEPGYVFDGRWACIEDSCNDPVREEACEQPDSWHWVRGLWVPANNGHPCKCLCPAGSSYNSYLPWCQEDPRSEWDYRECTELYGGEDYCETIYGSWVDPRDDPDSPYYDPDYDPYDDDGY